MDRELNNDLVRSSSLSHLPYPDPVYVTRPRFTVSLSISIPINNHDQPITYYI